MDARRRAMIEGAIAKGVEEICITSHYDADYPLAPHLNFDIDAKQYAADVLAAKEAVCGPHPRQAGPGSGHAGRPTADL